MGFQVELLPGLAEGIARALSQAAVYYIDSRKTIEQVFDAPGIMCAARSNLSNIAYLTGGAFWSSLSAGVAFYTYFSLYHTAPVPDHFKGMYAAFFSSFVKIPMSNCMRIVQSGLLSRPCMLKAGRHILRVRGGPIGLYNGFFWNFIEDAIEIDLRVRIFNALTTCGTPVTIAGVLAGSLTALVTHPLDTIKARGAILGPGRQIAQNQSTHHMNFIAQTFALYRGAPMRALSNGVKGALFFTILDQINRTTKTKN
jgi:hypothetical protein